MISYCRSFIRVEQVVKYYVTASKFHQSGTKSRDLVKRNDDDSVAENQSSHGRSPKWHHGYQEETVSQGSTSKSITNLALTLSDNRRKQFH